MDDFALLQDDIMMADATDAFACIDQANGAAALIVAENYLISNDLRRLAYGTPTGSILQRHGADAFTAVAALEHAGNDASLQLALGGATDAIVELASSLAGYVGLEAAGYQFHADAVQRMLKALPPFHRVHVAQALKSGNKGAVKRALDKLAADRSVGISKHARLSEALRAYLPNSALKSGRVKADFISAADLKKEMDAWKPNATQQALLADLERPGFKLVKDTGLVVQGARDVAAHAPGSTAVGMPGSKPSQNLATIAEKKIPKDTIIDVEWEPVKKVKAGAVDLHVSAPKSAGAAEVISKNPGLRTAGKWALAALGLALATKVGFYLTKSTTGAVREMMALPLPNDESAYNAYVKKLTDIMNSKTNFKVQIGSYADHSANIPLQLDKVHESAALHEDAMKRFSEVPDQLTEIARAAKDSGNQWQTRGAVTLSQLVHAIIGKATSGGGVLHRLKQRLDELRD